MPRVYNEVMNVPVKDFLEKYTLPNNMVMNVKTKGAKLIFGGEASVEILQDSPSKETHVQPTSTHHEIQE